MWIARDKNGELWLHSSKPSLDMENNNGCWSVTHHNPLFWDCPYGGKQFLSYAAKLNEEAYPEVTFENSPKELVIK